MGDDPGKLSHVKAPWDPTQALKRWQPSTAGVSIPVGDLLGKLRDKVKEKLAPLGRDLQEAGEAMDAALDFVGGEMNERGKQLRDSGNEVLEGLTARAPNVNHAGSREETGAMKSTSVAHETVPPEPPRRKRP